MTDTGVLAALALLLLAAGALVVARRARQHAGSGTAGAAARDDDAIDYSALEQAEREVRGVEDNGAGGPPDRALGDDWGPGTPRPPHRL